MSLLGPDNNNQYEISGSVNSITAATDVLLYQHMLPNDGNYMEKISCNVIASTDTQIATVEKMYIVRRRLGQDIEIVMMPSSADVKYTSGISSTPSGITFTSLTDTGVEPQTVNVYVDHDLTDPANIYASGHICTNHYE